MFPAIRSRIYRAIMAAGHTRARPHSTLGLLGDGYAVHEHGE